MFFYTVEFDNKYADLGLKMPFLFEFDGFVCSAAIFHKQLYFQAGPRLTAWVVVQLLSGE